MIFGGGIFIACVTSCGGTPPPDSKAVANASPPKVLSPSAAVAPASPEDAESETTIRYLEDRVRRDPEDYIALTKLAGYYLQRLRETGNVQYLELTTRAAQGSLKVLPAEQNRGALTALAQAEFASHEFAAARDHALQLVESDKDKTYPYLLLGDAQLELGEYDKANDAFQQMERRGFEGDINPEIRRARFAQLRGNEKEATQRLTKALQLARNTPGSSRETVAWLHWQLGEIAFALGDYKTSEQKCRDSLETLPNYYRALGSLGRAIAAQNKTNDAIEQYDKAVKRLPDPVFLAALGDLYKLAGREPDATAQYSLVENIAHLSQLNGQLYNRSLALFYADHDIRTDEAYNLAVKEYEARHDIYGADALAWTALKANKIPEAQTAIKNALRLGTHDARIFYHAGMIARAAGNKDEAQKFLQQALALNPQFDPLQAPLARKALEAG
ncbi:MAG: hypothetical protein NVSMB56_02410 [Pyrinomonadaceae bacterium]